MNFNYVKAGTYVYHAIVNFLLPLFVLCMSSGILGTEINMLSFWSFMECSTKSLIFETLIIRW